MNISRCDHIRKHVKNLTLSFELLQKEPATQECYLYWLYHQQVFQCASLLQTAPPRPLTFANIGPAVRRSDWTFDRVSTAYDSYKLRVEEQKTMEALGMDVVVLAAAFARLDNLRGIHIKSDYYGQINIGPTESPRDIVNLQKEILLSPFYTRRSRLRDVGRLHLRDLIRAASVAGPKITDINISASVDMMSPRILALRPEDLHMACLAFQYVKRFYFSLPDYSTTPEDIHIFATGQLARLIQAMPNLEELTLVSATFTCPIPWAAVFGTGRWGSLCVLDLQCFDFHETEFMEFLIRHKSTLHTVKLFCVELYSGTFISLLYNMRENLRLTSLELDGVLEDTAGNFLNYSYNAADALADYVTRRNNIFPFSKLKQHQIRTMLD
ncbi:hypothetical protein BP6252_05938 [Coleophoma cylindrospora]|uniref:Uncharacterized protein n=1 Tax=Coleophoma cylindrospora TaxID=1849047 RepID=A0A3D8RLI6_9HELO|nr:hypothetical protein BP6252_05938 [Coleophoma cylindrospora]